MDLTSFPIPTIQVSSPVGSFMTAANQAAMKTAVGLGNVNNTSDANKPVSTATQAALDLKLPLNITPKVIGDGDSTTVLLTDLSIDYQRTDGADLIFPDPGTATAGKYLLISNSSAGGFNITCSPVVPDAFYYGTYQEENSIPMEVGQTLLFAVISSKWRAISSVLDIHATWGDIIGNIADQADLQAALDGKISGPNWVSLISQYGAEVPVRGFLNNFDNFGSGQQDAICYTDGVETFFQGTIKLTSGTLAQGVAMYDVPNGFCPATVQRPSSSMVDVNGGPLTISCAIPFDPLPLITGKPEAAIYYATQPTGLAFIENSCHVRASGYLTSVLRNVIGSDNVSIWLPKPLPTSSLKLCFYFHGSGDDYLSHATSPAGATSTQNLFLGTMQALLEDGWILLTSDGGPITSNWGNPASWTATQAALAWAQSILPVSKTTVLGQSMGGIPALRACAQYPGITRFYGIYPAIDLNYMHSSSMFTAEIDTAFDGDFAGNSPGCDPMLFTLSDYAGKSFRMTASNSDTVVSKANNSDAFATLVTGTAADVTVDVVGGNHGSPLAFLPTATVDFLNL